MFSAASVSLCVCLFVCQHDSFRTSKHRIMKLGGRCTVQKSRPNSNLGVIGPLSAHPQNVACGYDVGEISAGCLVWSYFRQSADLTFSKHVAIFFCSSTRFYRTNQLRRVTKSLTAVLANTDVHALVANRFDYCSDVFYQISAASLQALQSVFNASAPLIMWKWKYDYITATLHTTTYNGYVSVGD